MRFCRRLGWFLPLFALSLGCGKSSEPATAVHRTFVRYECRRGWPRAVPVLLGAWLVSALIVWLGRGGWMLPGVGAGMMCVLAFFTVGAVWRRWAAARGAAGTALL